MPPIPPQVPFGAVYFRKSNPPREDWARDYAVAAEDGLNTFRHWFMWSAIERAPGRYDWDDCDRQLDLAAENGLRTVIAELTHTAPDWAYRRFAHARQLRADGTPMPSIMGVSAATGGFAPNGGGGGSLTFNCPEVWEAARAFLSAMAERYRGHPGLWGYDVWNECNYSADVDYSDWTKAAFRDWLRAKHGDLESLAVAWNRYSYAEWDDIEPPVQVAPYPECLDWMEFKRDDYYRQMQMRIETIRAADPDCLIAAHGIAGAITDMALLGCDDWLAASKVQVYGYTWIPARKGNEPWRNFFAGDLIRGASRGKPFWHAERQGGPLWMQPQVRGRDQEDGRVAEPEDIRLWSLASFAAGARGMMNLRYRPLLDGPLFGAFGSYGMDGSRTDRSEMAAAIGRWANAPEQAALMEAKPVRGEVGLLMVPETQAFDTLLSYEGGFRTYAQAMWGAYVGYLEAGIQPDWVHVDDIDAYPILYAPYPIMWPEAVARRLADWVAKGGRLICEACPGYFGDRGRVGVRQPNHGMDEVFGAREIDVEFMPDIADRIRLTLNGTDLAGGGFRQAYEAVGGKVLGRFPDGRAAVVENDHGSGRTLLVGTHVSAGHFRDREARKVGAESWWAFTLDWAGVAAHVETGNRSVVARLHEGETGRYLWLINPTRDPQAVSLRVNGAAVEGRGLWGEDAQGSRMTIPGRDAIILRVQG